MLSKGGKIIWLCPLCNSENIKKTSMKGYGQANSGECLHCRTWWHWSERIKIPVKNNSPLPTVLKPDEIDF